VPVFAEADQSNALVRDRGLDLGVAQRRRAPT